MGPELEEFTLEFYLVAVGFDLSGGFELDPIYGDGGIGGSTIPDLVDEMSVLAVDMRFANALEGCIEYKRTSIDFTTNYHFDLAEASADHRAVLRVVIDNLILTRLDVLP